ncbi:hypothetical protein JCM8547_007328 [Rhodosporidiobolus lusitaniae]
MGVHGLWSLVSPCARPIQLETLGGKRLAIDASIWLYQFQMAMRDKKTGDTLQGAHIMGTFRRITKLMFHGIKPVFVFDGDAPMLKKRTIEKRKRRKAGAGRDLAKTAAQLLAAQLRGTLAEKEINKQRKKTLDQDNNGEVDTGEQIGDDAVYLEDLEQPSPVKAARKDALRDEYALPKIDGSLQSRAKASDPRIATEEELREFIEDLRPEDLDINSSFFGNLPTEVKYEILGDLRIKTRQVNHKRVQQMRDFSTAHDFSRAQIDNLMERNLYTQKLLDITDELGRSAIAIPTRVAGQRNREYILVKQDVSKGGGWVLGVKGQEAMSKEPIVIDTTTDESVGAHTDTDEFEEVGVDSSPEKKKVGLPTPELEARRLLAIQAVQARYSSTSHSATAADPYLDQPIASTSRATTSLFGTDTGADEDDVALQQALFASAQASAGSPTLPRLPLPSAPLQPIRLPSLSAPRPAPSTAPVDSAPAHEETDDDDMEYVEVPPQRTDKGKGRAEQEPAVIQQSHAGGSSDTEGSDAFEEVQVVAASTARPPKQAPPVEHAEPLRRPSPAVNRPPDPSPPPQQATRSMFDLILPSDSEDEHDAPTSSPQRSAPASPRKAPAFTRHSTSPNPFAEFEARAAPNEAALESHDFAYEQQVPDSTADVETAELAPKLPIPPLARQTYEPLSSFVSSPPSLAVPVPSPPPLSIDAVSPTDLPFPLPPLEKAQEAVEAVEAADLPADFARLPSPRLPSPHRLPPPPSSAASRLPTPLPIQPRAPYVPRNPTPFVESPVERSPTLQVDTDDALTQDGADVAQEAEQGSQGAEPAKAAGDGSEPEEFFSDWSRSPSPPTGRRRSGEALFLTDADGYDSEAEAEEAARAMLREEADYADTMAQLRSERLEKMKNEAEADFARLSEKRNTEQRNADGVTRQMAVEIKELLILFGIPYIDAPQEAEAECASLLQRNLVDGIVTDDSDVFLFGGSRIYRNMFADQKYVECYLLADLEREIGLDRDKLVRLAFLLGSDYTDGLPGVGPVLGMELLDEFPGEKGLQKFKQWWAKVQSGKDEAETVNTWRKRFRKSNKKLILDSRWPDPEVAQAYYRPTVQESNETFVWAGVDLDGLRHYLAKYLGWDQTKSDQTLVPLIKREQERKEGKLKGQGQLTDFFDYSGGYQPFSRKKQPKYASKRLQNVVSSWKKSQNTSSDARIEEVEGDEGEEQPAPSTSKGKERKGRPNSSSPRKHLLDFFRAAPAAIKPKPRKKSTVTSRKKADQAVRDARAAENGGVYLTDDEYDGAGPAPKQTGKKRAQPARKKRKTTTARTIQPSSDEDDE